ncbi:MAG: hypothetical protein AAF742_03070, partial [Pseudomonadota bacterium]
MQSPEPTTDRAQTKENETAEELAGQPNNQEITDGAETAEVLAPDQSPGETTEDSVQSPAEGAEPEAGAPSDLESVLSESLAGNEESAIEDLIGVDLMLDRGIEFFEWTKANLLSLDNAIQLGLLIGALLPAALFGPQLKRLIQTQLAPRVPYGVLRRAANAFANLATPIALYIFLQISVPILGGFGRSSLIIQAATSLLSAWIVIRLVTLVIRSPFWSR